MFARAAERIARTDRLALVDCQIRPSAIPQILEPGGIESWMSVLHDCPDNVREARLRAGNWNPSAFPRVANWARILLAESRESGDLVVDTSSESTEQICARILRNLHRKARDDRLDAGDT